MAVTYRSIGFSRERPRLRAANFAFTNSDQATVFGIYENQSSNFFWISAGKHLDNERPQRMADKNVWAGDFCGLQQPVKFIREISSAFAVPGAGSDCPNPPRSYETVVVRFAIAG